MNALKNEPKNLGWIYYALILLFVCFVSVSWSQDKIQKGISGKVMEGARPLGGATITILPDGFQTLTNEKGEFYIHYDSSLMGKVLSVRFIGYRDVTQPLQLEQTVYMTAAPHAVEDVLVTGYQEIVKKNFTGAYSAIEAKDLTQVGAMNIDQMLEGKLAGLFVTGNIGNPGASPKIRIRGTSSLAADQEPLWVVDGVIYEESVNIHNRDLASLESLNNLNMIGSAIAGVNPKDIASISILKDAAATAIYGVRAANGVIVITTKRGLPGKGRINYSNDFNIRQRPYYSQYNLMNSAERVKTSMELHLQGLLYYTMPSSATVEGAILDYHRKNITWQEFLNIERKFSETNTDWFDLLFRNSLSHNHSINYSGGNESFSYYLSGSYYDERSNAKGVGVKRYGTYGRFSNKITKRLSTDIKFGFNVRKNVGYPSSINPYDYAVRTNRSIAAFEEEGNRNFYPRGLYFKLDNNQPEYFTFNIQNELDNMHSKTLSKEINMLMSLRYKIHDDLQLEGMAAYNHSNGESQEWASEYTYAIANGGFRGVSRGFPLGYYGIGDVEFDRSKLPFGGVIYKGINTGMNYTVRGQGNWKKQLGANNALHVIGGLEARSRKFTGNNDLLLGYFPDRGQSITTPTTSGYKSYLDSYPPVSFTNTVNNFFSAYGIVNYDLKDYLYISGSVRNDGSNIFGKDKTYRYQPIWSLSSKWVVSEMNFMRSLQSTIPYLALRASYGLQGNIHSMVSPSIVLKMGNLDGVTNKYRSSILSLPNPGLRWEKTYSTNLGFDVTITDRLDLTIEAYRKLGKDLVTTRRVSAVTGRSNIQVNTGDMENKGFEITAKITPVRFQNFRWQMLFTGGRNFNKILKADPHDLALNNLDDRLNLLQGNKRMSGDTYGTIYGYQYEGLNSLGWPTFAMKDGTNGHMGFISQTNIIPIGSKEPYLAGGIDNLFSYKNLTLRTFFAYSIGSYKRLDKYYNDNGAHLFPFEQNFSREFLNRWKKEGDEAHTDIPVVQDLLQLGVVEDGPNYTATENGFVWYTHTAEGIHMHELYNYSDLRTVDASYIRLRAVNVQYSLPTLWVARYGVQGLSINFSAQNLWFWTADKKKTDGRDPEVIGYNYAMPLPKIFQFGLNVTL